MKGNSFDIRHSNQRMLPKFWETKRAFVQQVNFHYSDEILLNLLLRCLENNYIVLFLGLVNWMKNRSMLKFN